MDIEPPPSLPASDIAAPTGSRPKTLENRLFVFVHRLFAAPGAVFKLDPNTGEPVLALDLGNVKANLPFHAVMRAFDITHDSPDARQLDAVAKGLRHVRQIRPGDSIPAELLDGSASWKVEPRHVAAAKGRLIAGLPGAPGRIPAAKSSMEFAVLANDAAIAPLVREFYAALGESLGPPAKSADEAEAAVDALSEEFAYIEALRERIAGLRALIATLRAMRDAYRRDRTVLERISRTIQLLERPIAAYERRFEAFDKSVASTADVTRNAAQHIGLARELRDTMHAETMRWDETITAWAIGLGGTPRSQRARIDETYRFAARHFPIASDWGAG
jgi:hypothetical protein